MTASLLQTTMNRQLQEEIILTKAKSHEFRRALAILCLLLVLLLIPNALSMELLPANPVASSDEAFPDVSEENAQKEGNC